MTQDVLDVAVIGAGSRGATHLDTIARLTDLYRLVGVCDAREEQRSWAAATYGAPVFDHPVALIESTKPQVVAIVVPPDAHHLITAAAAARGCHVLSETPIATTRAMADHMIETCRRAGVVLEVSENVWRFPQERLKRLALDAGLIGAVHQVHLWYTSGSYHGMSALRRFITTPPRRVQGVSRSLPVHRFIDIDGSSHDRRTWELGVIEFESPDQVAVYQWPVGSDRSNFWEVVGTEGAFMGPDLLRFDGPNGARRRIPVETVHEQLPDGGRALAAMRYSPGEAGGGQTVTWENPYRRYRLPGPDDVARADIYAGLHERITSGQPGGQRAVAGGERVAAGGQQASPGAGRGWPMAPSTGARFYGAAQGRADQEVLLAIRESALRGNTWLDLPLPVGEETAFERKLHQEFEQTYGAPPFEDPEALLARAFPRRGLVQTVH